MKSNLQLLIIFFLLTTGRLFAQDALAMTFPEDSRKTSTEIVGRTTFEFRASANNFDLSSISADVAGTHFLGDKIARKLYLLESKYTYEVPIVPGNPQTKTVVRKPIIYDAVLKIERYLKKSVKKGELSVETATKDFDKVLDVAFNILTVDTESFEKAINGSNDAASLTNLFTERVNLVF